ncbi:MAG: hypothetical protein WAW37_13565 [Syntrophobacteraceae bacterium]
MRARNIKPGFFKNEDLSECDPLARILFAGLWCMADRKGRLEYRPKRIKAELLPYDSCEVVELLQQLECKGFLICYKVSNSEISYIQVVNFTKHQNPHRAEKKSTIPAPGENRSCPADSGFLIPDSGYPIPDSPPIVPRRGDARAENASAKRASSTKRKDASESDTFRRFFTAYPKKQNRLAALKAWNKLSPNDALTETIIQAVTSRAASHEWRKEKGQYIPLPSSFLKGRRWEDEAPAALSSVGLVSEKTARTIENLKDWRPGGPQ